MRCAWRGLKPERCIRSGTISRRCEGARAFCDHHLHHRPVQAQIGHDLLELAVLFLKLPQPPQLRRAHAALLLAPDVERHIADAHLASNLTDADPQHHWLQRKRDLIFSELTSLHDMLRGPVRADHAGNFCDRTVRITETGSVKHEHGSTPISSDRLLETLAGPNTLGRNGPVKGLGDIDLLRTCDISRQWKPSAGYVLAGQTLDRNLAETLSQWHVFSVQAGVEGGDPQREQRIKEMVGLMFSRPFAQEEERSQRIREQLADFAPQLAQCCKQACLSNAKISAAGMPQER